MREKTRSLSRRFALDRQGSGSLLVLAFALVQAALYCFVLPLWEGFDEPFHYSYVETLRNDVQFPVMNRTPLAPEIRYSLDAVPLSRLLSQALPGSISFEQWAKLPQRDRVAREAKLGRASNHIDKSQSIVANYEAQQAPLAYIALVPFDFALSDLPLRWRILCLRLIGSLAAATTLFLGLRRFAVWLQLAPAFRNAALVCIFEGQMLWASVAHVGNDLLAIPLTVWLLVLLGESAAARSSGKTVVALSSVLAAGLLAKAYFLAFVPVIGLLLLRLLLSRRISGRAALSSAAIMILVPGPWYVRNLLLYKSLSGTQQSAAGIGLSQALSALPQIPWLSSGYRFLHWSIWTGNWSFLSFSTALLNLELSLLAAALMFYLHLSRRISEAERWIHAACTLFAVSLIYQTCVTWVHTRGQSTFPEPWYGQGVLVVAIVLLFRGLAAGGKAGSAIASLLLTVCSWIALLTYWAKLLPYYGGAVSRSSLHALWNWWTLHPTRDLSTVTLAPVPLVYVFLGLFTVLLLAVSTAALKHLRPRMARTAS